MKEEKIRSLV